MGDTRHSENARPSENEAAEGRQTARVETFLFSDDGATPNHPQWPLIVYRGAVRLPPDRDPAAVFEALFALNGWGGSWRNGVYPYTHYHSRTHEVLGIACGNSDVQFGGEHGQTLRLEAGDVAVLPAGTGHKRIASSDDLLVVGAYPPDGVYDECRSSADRVRALASIPKVARPETDPVFGANSPMLNAWPASA